jgi:tRNA A-37 threonylcarbamoyl transferase component Bud32/tetratricopeptide (TPR) repeat protein
MSSPRPSLLSSPSAQRAALLEDRARVRAAQEASWRQGQRVLLESYLEQYPTLSEDPATLLALLSSEVVLREQCGETPALEEYQKRFPPLATQLEALFQARPSDVGNETLTRTLTAQGGVASPGTDARPRIDTREDDPYHTVAPAAAPTPAEAYASSPPVVADAAKDSAPAALLACEPSPDAADVFHTRTGPQVAPTEGELLGWPTLPGYDILQELGRGGMGIVYRALDRQHNQIVALKTLQGMSASALYRFKREFRMLAGVTHRNLVPLYELVSDGKQWCFTMELLEGVDLLSYVRLGQPAPGQPRPRGPAVPLLTPEQFQRLRGAVAQLAAGIEALHQADRLHRDIKPSNALVTAQGRTVLLDFGLATELGEGGIYQSTEQHVLGTAAYMSPEQAAAQPVTAATDWYSVGVILYEALTGRLPFTGSPLSILRDKVERDPAPPQTLTPGIPEDLARLCEALLSRDPAARPGAAEVFACLNATPSPAPAAPRLAGTLLGRDAHLQALEDAYQTMRSGRTVVVHVAGQSGMGKSALITWFLSRLRQEGQTVILAGQCYEKESVPYKAFDSLIDELSQYLGRLPVPELQALMPRDIVALTRVFPVLRYLQEVAALPRSAEIADPHELRRRAFAALRELLARLGDRKPVVLAIDDLQWGDPDSAALLTDLLRPPDPPVLLLMSSYRSEEADSSAFLRTWLATSATEAVERRQVLVQPLTVEEGQRLGLQLLGRHDSAALERARAVAEESGGNPFFIYELAQYLKAGGGLGAAAGARRINLGDVLWSRLQRLPQEAQHLLELIAVAGRPVPLTVASAAAHLGPAEMPALAALRDSRFIRSTGLNDDDVIATYHDRIRETVTERLAAARRQAHHLDLAGALEAAGHTDAEFLAVHFHAGQETEKARAYYAQAATEASQALAFDRAARLYRQALELTPESAREARRTQRPAGHATQRQGPRSATLQPDQLRAALGDALANAGRGSDAAAVYLEAAERNPDPDDALELRRQAATQLLRSGRVDRGLAVLGTVLQAVGMEWPRSSGRAFRLLLWRRFRLWWRGLGFREVAASDLPPETLRRIDLCWSVGSCITFIDWIRGAELEGRGLLLALKAGEPERIAPLLAMEAGHAGCSGGPSAARAARVLQAAEDLARKVDRPYVWGVLEASRGAVATNIGRWKEVCESCRRAEEIFRRQCPGAVWELDTARGYDMAARTHMGEIGELSGRLPAILQDARQRDDRYLISLLGAYSMTVVLLAQDNPQQAQQELNQIRQQSSQKGFHLQHHAAFLGQVLIALYRGDGAAAMAIVAEHVPAYRKSLLWYIQHLRIDVLQYHARSALAAAATAQDPAPFLKVARRRARDLERERMPWATALARLIQACVAATSGDSAQAVELFRLAIPLLESVDMPIYAAAARRRLGALLGGDEGRALVAEGDAWMTGQAIRSTERMTAMYAPLACKPASTG